MRSGVSVIGVMARAWPAVALGLVLAACAGGPEAGPAPAGPAAPTAGAFDLAPLAAPLPQPGEARAREEGARPAPHIVKASRQFQCVPYAREASGIALRGNAWTWWRSAEKRYRRGDRPRPGSVMVLKKTGRLRLGHLAVVKAIVNEREILVDHANWLNRGRLHLDTPVRDVSADNDWSLVRVWYTPGRQYGKRRYPVQGFIYPELLAAQARPAGGTGTCAIDGASAPGPDCPRPQTAALLNEPPRP